MLTRRLGRTGLDVGVLALGTVELGIEYGISVPGSTARPSEEEAIRILRRAADAGVNLFDTAPAYGDSERLLGAALGDRNDCYFATKVSIPRGGDAEAVGQRAMDAVTASIVASTKALRRQTLDIVQIHNATVEVLRAGHLTEALEHARRRGLVRFLGASVYSESEALAGVEVGAFDVLQIAYSVLDQRMSSRVFARAAEAGVGIIARSALLKGALTEKAEALPPSLAELRTAARRARDVLAGDWSRLPSTALRFALSTPAVSAVLIGVRSADELEVALTACAEGPLDDELLRACRTLALTEDHLLNPSRWALG